MKQFLKKHFPMLLLILAVVMFGSGCVRYAADGTPTGWVYEYIGRPASSFLNFLANLFGGSYGLAIIIVTVITRLLMLPSSLKMTKSSMVNQARMKIAQPEIDEIKAEMEATTDPTEKAQLQNELLAVHKKYNIDMLGGLSGCLPILIQMPIISAVYAAIRSSQEINDSTFLGVHLGSKSFIIVVLVVVFSFLQSWLMQQAMPKPQDDNEGNDIARQTNNTMLWMNPIMFGWISYASNAGLGLYFLTGSIFMLFQQLYSNHVVRPKIQKMLDEEEKQFAATPRKKRKAKEKANQTTPDGAKRLVPTKNPVIQDDSTATRRNAGKQSQRNISK